MLEIFFAGEYVFRIEVLKILKYGWFTKPINLYPMKIKI